MDTNKVQPLHSEDLNADNLAVRLNLAIELLYLHVPFWALLLENLSIHVTRGVPTAAVDTFSSRMYLNPEFVADLSNTHFSFLIAHEVAHVAFNSTGRRQGRDPEKWNIATDYAINAVLRASFGSMPEGALYKSEYEDTSAEEIFTLLDDMPQLDKLLRDVAPNDVLLQPLSEDTNTQEVRGGKQPADTEKGDNSGSKANPDWNAEITKAMTHAKMQGKVSSNFERKLTGEKDSQINWQSVLRQKVSQQLSRDGRDDFSYIPPNRRFLYQDIILPSPIGRRKPTLAYCVDTSGSMSSEELEQGIAEIDSIRQILQARLYFMVCDYDITTSKWIEPNEDIPVLTGGGGTSFVPIFDKLEEENIDCDVVVIFTDGYGTFPESDRGYDTIWVMTSNVEPSFGECVNVRIPTRCDI